MGRSVHSTFVFPHHSGARLVSRGGLRSGGLPCLSALSVSLMTAGFLFCGAASPVLAESVYSDISDPYMVFDHVVLGEYADHSSTNVTQSGHLELLDTNFYTDNLEVSGQLTVGSGAHLENVYGPAEEFAGTAELHSGARLQVEVNGYAELWEVVSRGGSLILSATATEASDVISNAEAHIQKLTADTERTLVTVGEDNAQADLFSTLMIEELSVSSGGHLDIRVGSGGAFVWTHAAFDDGNEAGTDPIENFFLRPPRRRRVRFACKRMLHSRADVDCGGREQHGTGGSLQSLESLGRKRRRARYRGRTHHTDARGRYEGSL